MARTSKSRGAAAFKMRSGNTTPFKDMGSSLGESPVKSIVAQTRTQADPSLVEAGRLLGESVVPHAIDYGLGTKTELDFAKKKKEEGCKKKECKENEKWSKEKCACIDKEDKEDKENEKNKENKEEKKEEKKGENNNEKNND